MASDRPGAVQTAERLSTDEGKKDPSLTELKWQRETLWGISRSIEELVRRGGRERLRNALGIIAYAESYQSVLAGLVRQRGYLNRFVKVSDFHRYDFKAFRESIRIMLDRRSWKLGLNAAMAGSVAAIGMSSILATNAIANHLTDKAPNIWSGRVAEFFARYPLTLPFSIVVVMSIIYQRLMAEQALWAPLGSLERFWRRFTRSHVRFMVGWVPERWRPIAAVLLTLLAYGLPTYALIRLNIALLHWLMR